MTPNEIEELVPVVQFEYSDDIWKNKKIAKKLLKPSRDIFFRIRYKAPGLCQVDGAKEYKDGYCVQHYHLSLLLREWEQSPLSLYYSKTLARDKQA